MKHKTTLNHFAATLLAMSALAILSGCGGGGDAPPTSPAPVPTTPTPTPTPPVSTLPDVIQLLDVCQHPRVGLSPSGLPYYDRQGTLTDELKWLRSYINELYLWYREVPTDLRMEDYSRPVDYFAVLKTTALTPSGRPKDRYHFTYPSAQWDAMSESGVELGYGISWLRSAADVQPRFWQISMVEPGSPAAVAGAQRGDVLLSVDGVPFSDNSSAGVAAINAGLFPQRGGVSHRIEVGRNGAIIALSLVAREVVMDPVQNVQVLDTATGKVGYLLFNDHNNIAETELINAFSTFRKAVVSDLVLDMRYNGGGLLSIASELAYMIAGPGATTGKIFEHLLVNDKSKAVEPLAFASRAAGHKAPVATAAGTELPYLGLKRVTVLTSPGTCSASESVINSLRGIDVEVNLIGGETCGKPYAFTPVANCGTTYFAIQYQGANHKGFGDYADGFQPTCRVSDDLSRPLGDPAEGMLAAALSYRTAGVCPAVPQRRALNPVGVLQLVRPAVKEIAIQPPAR